MPRGTKFLLPRIVKRFKKDEDGVTAVEFAIIGLPFFTLIFAIIESSLFFFAGQYLESTVDDVSRLFRTGQLDSGTTEQEFRDEFCSRIVAMFDCDDVRLELQVALDFADLNDPDPLADDPDDDADSMDTPGAGVIMQLSAQYRWPVFTQFSAPLLHSPTSDYALLQVVAVTRSEPYE